MVNSNDGAPLLEEIMRAVARAYAWPGCLPEENTSRAADIDAQVVSNQQEHPAEE